MARDEIVGLRTVITPGVPRGTSQATAAALPGFGVDAAPCDSRLQRHLEDSSAPASRSCWAKAQPTTARRPVSCPGINSGYSRIGITT
jgi:hypothetical protein